MRVLYEDNHLIAVFKPAGLLAQGDETGDPTLVDEVRDYLKEKYKKPGNVFVGLIHRLDRPVSGIVLLAKTSKGAARLSEQIRNHELVKIYTALVVGKPEYESAKLVHFLFKNNETKKSEVYLEEAPGRDYAELSYEIIKSNGKFSLLKVKLETGRFHQIRAQLSHIGHPIVGDKKYGDRRPAMGDEPICLCATELIFETATGDEIRDLKIDYPKEWDDLLK